jgi:hypothetical protein
MNQVQRKIAVTHSLPESKKTGRGFDVAEVKSQTGRVNGEFIVRRSL